MAINLEALLKSVRTRKGGDRWGIGTAARYLRDIQGCFVEGGICPTRIFSGASEAQWLDAIKQSEQKLTYCHEEMVVEKGGLVTNSSDFRAFAGDDAEIPEKTLMLFRNIVTTPRKDRDGDILRTEGAQPDPKMPFLLHHTPMLVCGKMISILDHTAKHLRVLTGICDNACGQDAATLIEFGALRISHGFLPEEFEPLRGKGETGWDIKKFQILEESGVPIPSNTEAVIELYSRQKLTHPANKAWGKSLLEGRAKQHRGVTIPVVIEVEIKQTKDAAGCACGHAKDGGNEDGDMGGDPNDGYFAPTDSENPAATQVLADWSGDTSDHAHAQHSGELWTKGVTHDGWQALYDESQQRLGQQETGDTKAYRGVQLDATHPLAKAVSDGTVGTGSEFAGYGMTLTGWTGDMAKAEQFARTATQDKASGAKVGLVLERDVPAEQVVAGHMTHTGFDQSLEVIAKNPASVPVKVASVCGTPQKTPAKKDNAASLSLNFDLSCTDPQRGFQWDQQDTGAAKPAQSEEGQPDDSQAAGKAAIEPAGKPMVWVEFKRPGEKYFGGYQLEGSFEELTAALNESATDYLLDQVDDMRASDYAYVVATYPNHAIVCVCRGWSDDLEDSYFDIAWSMVGSQPEWTGDPTPVEVKLVAEALQPDKAFEQASRRVPPGKLFKRSIEAAMATGPEHLEQLERFGKSLAAIVQMARTQRAAAELDVELAEMAG